LGIDVAWGQGTKDAIKTDGADKASRPLQNSVKEGKHMKERSPWEKGKAGTFVKGEIPVKEGRKKGC